MSRRARRAAFAGLVAMALLVVAERAAVRYLSVAPNADEPAPTDAREHELFFEPPYSGVRLAYEVMSPQDAPRFTAFVLHGMRDSRGSMVPWAKAIVSRGGRAVLVDARGHGRSTGKTFGYGVRESRDVMALADDLGARGMIVGKLGVLGFSFGGATAIQWAGRDPRVAAVVGLAPFATMDFVGAKVRVPVPAFVVRHVTTEVAARADIDPNEAGGLPWVDKTSAPILFVHGDDDHSVPLADSRDRMHPRAPKGSELVVLSGATHASTLHGDEELYAKAAAWLADHL